MTTTWPTGEVAPNRSVDTSAPSTAARVPVTYSVSRNPRPRSVVRLSMSNARSVTPRTETSRVDRRAVLTTPKPLFSAMPVFTYSPTVRSTASRSSSRSVRANPRGSRVDRWPEVDTWIMLPPTAPICSIMK